MKKIICFLNFIVIVNAFLQLPQWVYALEYDFQPRIEVGAMFYSVEIGAASKSLPTSLGGPTGYNETQQKIAFNDVLSFIGVGGTLFFNRLFVDLSLQAACDGSDHTTATFSIYNEDDDGGVGTFTSAAPEYRGQFDRLDRAVAIGLSLTKQLSIYAGYKWDGIDLDTTFNGPYSLLNIDNWVANGRVSGHEEIDFKYEGPFVGATHGWLVAGNRFFNGMVSVNLGFAYLSSTLQQDQIGTIRIDSINGEVIDPFYSPYSASNEIKGDTLGVTLGLFWRGETQNENLSYSIGLSGYRYQFDSENPNYTDITETAVTLKAGLSYLY